MYKPYEEGWELQTFAHIGARRWDITPKEIPDEIDREFYAEWIWKRGDEYWTPWMIWDIDVKKNGEGDLDAALIRARQLVRYLLDCKTPEEGIRIIFSTSKGFHIYLDSRAIDLKPSRILHRELYEFALAVLPETDESLYWKRRVLGIPNSRHRTTGLYYCPIDVEQFFEMSIDQMRVRAEATQTFSLPAEEMPVVTILRNKFLSTQKSAQIHPEFGGLPSPQEMIKRLRMPNSILRGVAEGSRNNSMFRAACYYRDKGLAPEETTILLEFANRNNTPMLKSNEVEKLITQAYKEWL